MFHPNLILFLVGIVLGAIAYMVWFNLFMGKTIDDIKNELYIKYKATKKLIESSVKTAPPIDK